MNLRNLTTRRLREIRRAKARRPMATMRPVKPLKPRISYRAALWDSYVTRSGGWVTWHANVVVNSERLT